MSGNENQDGSRGGHIGCATMPIFNTNHPLISANLAYKYQIILATRFLLNERKPSDTRTS
jgi:hypothetical protein